ncbi:unnamed protein product [Caenorhabditis bovis]|uniref:Uncharacterized protein n=1 Tax=Caenorhabditis bovis TaxID=2654633 RepID=A0A8S1F4N4_9PELO|nr:unnamed protein product [Caenorhabditis bovis]
MTELPTTPIGNKQSLIDLRAGTILREHSRKDNLYFGCPIGVLLVLIILLKCTFISIWIIREYDTFDFRCTSWDGETQIFRSKRWSPFGGNSDPRSFSTTDLSEEGKHDVILNDIKHKNPMYGGSARNRHSVEKERPKIDPNIDFGPLPPTFRRKPEIEHEENGDDDDDDLPLSTMVTLTNTQLIPLKGQDQGIVKMKTIRNRVEKIGSNEEQFVEIDIANAPRIYVSKIKSRHGGEQEEQALTTDFSLINELENEKEKEKKKKLKGKGLKKKKNKEKKRKHKNEKTNGNALNQPTTENTKSPRHLVSGGSTTRTTKRPHQSSWINGVIDPDDPKFSNQGEIRGYTMQTASRIPTTTPSSFAYEATEAIKVSENTRMMWEMDEIKYTTFLAPKTTEVTMFENRAPENNEIPPPPSPSVIEAPIVDEKISDGHTEVVTNAPSTTHKPAQQIRDGKPPLRKLMFEKKPAAPKKIVENTTKVPIFVGNTFVAPTESPYYVEVNDADTETIYIKDITPIYRNLLLNGPETTTKPYDPKHFEIELTRLKSSTLCLARMAFNVWCLFVLFSAVPFVMGMCVPRWSLFVLHIVFDFLFLVVGFVSSMTIAVMSVIVYFSIDEMTSDSLFEFLLVSFVIDIFLIIYSLIVLVAYRCCSRLVDNCIKDSNANYSLVGDGAIAEQV